MNKNNFLFALFLISFATIILPQDELEFERLSLQDGVAHNLTYSMLKDSKGFLWFGTMYGLARYEGSRYIMFKHDPEDHESISFDDIVSLYEDKKGNIWIGTWGGGLNKYDPYKGSFTRFIFQKDDPDGINDNVVWAITEDKAGKIWIGTDRGGLNCYSPETDEFTYYKHDKSDPTSIASNSIQSLHFDSKGKLWIGSTAGLSRFNRETNSFDNFINNSKDKNSISSGGVRVIYEDSKKNLWVGTTAGLNKFDGHYSFERYTSDQNPGTISHNSVACITGDKKGNLWVGTLNGLNYFDAETRKFTRILNNPDNPFSLTGNVIHNIVVDNSGLLWVNVYNSGINKSIRPVSSNFINLQSSEYSGTLSNSGIISMTEGQDQLIWLGTRNGLNSFDPYSNTVDRISLNENHRKNFISSLATDYNGNLWVGTQSGINLFSPDTKIFYEPDFKGLREAGLLSNHITSVFVDSLTVWIGTYSEGLFRLDRKNNTLSKFSFEGKHFDNYQADFIITIYKDRLNRIWIGSYGGLMMYNKKDNSFTSYSNNLNDETSLSNNYVFSIFEDSKNELWIGTANGLNRFSFGNSTFEHFFEKDGLPNSVICSIQEDRNKNLWISTNKGISKFNFNERLFTNYDLIDGLGGNLFNRSAGLSTSHNSIFFGGNWGCAMFYPGSMLFSSFNPPVYISSIKKVNPYGNTSLLTSFSDEIEASSSERVIHINFASLDFAAPEKNKFLYMLEGMDEDWINSGNRNSVTYSNLEPGEYVFKVRGTNSDGVFSSSSAELKLIVVPPFWQTWWFEMLFISVLFIGAYFIIKYNFKLKIKREIEFQKVREEEATKIRRQTAIDFHDELGHRLTRISLLTELIRKKLHSNFLEIDLLLRNISDNSHNLYEGTKDFVWAIDPEQDNLFDLIVRIKDFGDELFSGTNIRFNIKGLDESLKKYSLNIEWKRHVTLIFKEAMNNALKYSECSNITLEVLIRHEDEVEIFLFDDGKGFDVEKICTGNGIKNMKRRAEKIGGTTDIDSRQNIGTKIYFKGIIPFIYLDYPRKVA